MTKNQLIEALQEIEGDPEVCLWDGYVSDYNKLSAVSVSELAKKDISFIQSILEAEYLRDNKVSYVPEDIKKEILNTAKELHQTQEWDFANAFVEKSKFNIWYGTNIKKIILIYIEPRNKQSWDRLGGMKY